MKSIYSTSKASPRVVKAGEEGKGFLPSPWSNALMKDSSSSPLRKHDQADEVPHRFWLQRNLFGRTEEPVSHRGGHEESVSHRGRNKEPIPHRGWCQEPLPYRHAHRADAELGKQRWTIKPQVHGGVLLGGYGRFKLVTVWWKSNGCPLCITKT